MTSNWVPRYSASDATVDSMWDEGILAHFPHRLFLAPSFFVDTPFHNLSILNALVAQHPGLKSSPDFPRGRAGSARPDPQQSHPVQTRATPTPLATPSLYGAGTFHASPQPSRISLPTQRLTGFSLLVSVHSARPHTAARDLHQVTFNPPIRRITCAQLSIARDHSITNLQSASAATRRRIIPKSSRGIPPKP